MTRRFHTPLHNYIFWLSIAFLFLPGCKTPSGCSGATAPADITPQSRGYVFSTTDPFGVWDVVEYPGVAALNDVEFISPSLFITVGTGGAVGMSTDRGATWRTLPSGTAEHLRSIVGTGAPGGLLVVGFNGTILRSTDAGATWAAMSSGTTADLLGITALGNNAIAVGSHGTILRSSDRGYSWTPVASPTTATLTNVAVGVGDTLYAVGDGGTVIRSADRGATWNILSIPGLDSRDWLNGVHCPHVGNVFIGGYRYTDSEGTGGRIAVTLDGGRTWTIDSADRGATVPSLPLESIYALSGYGGTEIAVGKRVYVSTDGGRIWLRSYFNGRQYGVVMYGPNSAVAVGKIDN